MRRKSTICGLAATLLGITVLAGHQTASAAELSKGQQAVQTAASLDRFAFLLFYRSNDTSTQAMYQQMQSTLTERQDATIVPVRISDASERSLVDQFDASRTPMPAVVVLAPNGAVCSVFPQRVTAGQLTAAIVSPSQAECLKALQDQKIVLLCALPEETSTIPAGVREFQADALFKDRTEVVSVQANDPAEAQFLNQLKVRTDQSTPVTAFMAPPGVMLGIYDSNVSFDTLAQKLAAAGKCCDDPNCRHHKSAGGQSAPRR